MAAIKENSDHKKAFEVWYENSRDFAVSCGIVRKSDETLRRWAERFYWTARADERDAAVEAKLREEAIKRKAKTIEDQRKAGALLRQRGVEFFVQNKVEKATDAIAAVKAGVELERQAEGLPSWVLEIMNADADTLSRDFAELDARRRAAMAGLPSGDDSEGSADPQSGNGE